MLSHYWILAKFVSGKMPQGIDQRAIYSAIVTTAFGFSHIDSINNRISPKYLSTIEKISPKLAANLWSKRKRKEGTILACAKRLGLEAEVYTGDNNGTLPQMCRREDNPFLDEVNVLVLTKWLLENIESHTETLTPWNISCEVKREKGYQFGRVIPNRFSYVSADKATHLFEPSDWFETDEEKQKYQVGVIVRYAIRGSTNFYDSYRLNSKGHEYRYTKPVTNWEQQKYSGYQGREAFGPAWLPISSSTEEVLFELLRWPGSSQLTPPLSKQQLLNKVNNLLRDIKDDRGDFSSVLFLKQKVQRPEKGKGSSEEHFKIGIVQSVIPKPEDFNKNVMLQNQADFRLRHRLHLAEIMKGVTQMLRIRNTHSPSAAKHNLDLLIFPELAVHPNDIKHYILPFVRQYKCVVLFGQVYHPKYPNTSTPLINSCLWVVPQSDSSTKGLKIRYIEQGKRHLAKPEKELNGVVGFRPAQWLLKYFWSQEAKPLTLSASVCYDATDLALVADLRDKSDLYIICALNKDVNTFDQMSETLYYHMYQAVIIVNNGEYGGSSLHVPRKESVERHIFHLHGQSQASIAFAELDPNELLRDPKPELKEWKTPPAGFTKK